LTEIKYNVKDTRYDFQFPKNFQTTISKILICNLELGTWDLFENCILYLGNLKSMPKSTKKQNLKNKEKITIKGARVHNLKNIDVEIPKNKFVVITGISGSGKSSLAFDTIYAEGQRRYVESLSTYAKHFLDLQDKPDVDQISGLSPAIAIDQRSISHNPRSTVATVTEIYDYLRLLFARIGHPHCPNCGQEIFKQTKEQIIERIISLTAGKNVMILSPVIKDKKGEHKKILQEISKAGFTEVRLDGAFYPIEEAIDMDIDRDKKHTLDVVVKTLTIPKIKKIKKAREIEKDRKELESQNDEMANFVKSLDMALDLGDGLVIIYETDNNKEHLFSQHFSCPKCDIDLPEIEPRLFSFNSPHGACPECAGLGTKQKIDPDLVIPNKKLTIAQGAIRPWSRINSANNSRLINALEKSAEKANFSLHTPIKDLTKKQLDIVLYGDNNFEGVIPGLMKKYKETESDYIRNEIEKYMRVFPCPECGGKRLNKVALSVTLAGKNIAEICEMTIEEARNFFSSLS